ELTDQFHKELLFSGRPLRFDGVEIDRLGGLEKEGGLSNEIGQRGTAILDEIEGLFEPAWLRFGNRLDAEGLDVQHGGAGYFAERVQRDIGEDRYIGRRSNEGGFGNGDAVSTEKREDQVAIGGSRQPFDPFVVEPLRFLIVELRTVLMDAV